MSLLRQAQLLRRNRWEANHVFLLDPWKTIFLNYTIIPASTFLLPEEEHRNAWANKVMRWMVHLLSILFYWNGQSLALWAEVQNTLQHTGAGQFFPWKGFLLSLILCRLPELPFQTAAGSVPVAGSNSSLQKASSALLSHLNYFHHPTLYLRI